MAPSACLSPVVTLALLLLITGFALGGEFIFSTNLSYSYKSNITDRQFSLLSFLIFAGHHTMSKKKHHPHTMTARFLPLASDSAASSPQ